VTQTIVLEPLRAAHAIALYPLLADPDLWRFTDREPPASCEALAARYARLESRRSPDGRQAWLNWAVADAAGGFVGFVQATVENACAEIAYVIGARFQGRGYATRAVRAMLVELKRHHAVSRFTASVDERNTASVRLLARLNFVLIDATATSSLRFERAADDA